MNPSVRTPFDPFAAELHASLPHERPAESVVSALLSMRSIFDDELAANTTFTALLTYWYRIIENQGLDGLRNEINNG